MLEMAFLWARRTLFLYSRLNLDISLDGGVWQDSCCSPLPPEQTKDAYERKQCKCGETEYPWLR